MVEYDVGTAIVLLLGAASVLVLLATTIYACFACQSRGGKVVEDRNSGEKAVGYFMRVLAEANEQMIIHDDGDSVVESIYNNEKAMAALDRRLSDSELKVRILFNNPGVRLDILELAKKHGDQLLVRYRRKGRPVGDIHYKIADRHMGYFSEHDEGSSDRKIWIYEFGHAPRKARDRVFGDTIRRFEKEFKEAGVA